RCRTRPCQNTVRLPPVGSHRPDRLINTRACSSAHAFFAYLLVLRACSVASRFLNIVDLDSCRQIIAVRIPFRCHTSTACLVLMTQAAFRCFYMRTMPMATPRLNPYTAAPKAIQAMVALNDAAENCGLERSLIELVKIRASQINGCAYCIHMHVKDALGYG